MKKTICIIFIFGFMACFGTVLMPEEIYKTPTIKEMGGFWYVYMEFNTTFEGATEKGMFFLEECRKQGIKSDKILEVFHTWSDEKGAMIRWDMAYIVPEETKVAPPLMKTRLDRFKAMVYTHYGSNELSEIKKSFDVLKKSMAEKNLEKIPPGYEIIFTTEPRMDIVWRVKKK